MFSILHISDLHRSSRDPITNAELISALVADRERYLNEDPPIRAPDAIVVSGDLIQGVGLGAPNYEAELAEQYAVAEAFLGELADRFLSGNRGAVIVVPGNHDVDWNTAKSAMTLVAAADVPPNLAAALFSDRGEYRWNWKTRELFRITDAQAYARRLNAFGTFFERFYHGVPELLRVQRDADANLFALNNGTIGVAAFNSCHGNDCFAFHGYIPREVIARTHLDLNTETLSFDLLIAVWHHSMEGPPYRTDYMDIDIVRGMIGRGFRLGLYGHQHHAQVAPHEIYLPDRERMGVVSAGSLCAGASELPIGVYRQYNIIEVADDFGKATVHVRHMAAANLFGRATLDIFGGRSFATLNWGPRRDDLGRPINAGANRIRAAVEHAEVAFKSGDSGACVELLLPYRSTLDAYGRRLLVQSAHSSRNWGVVLDVTDPPNTIEELVLRVQTFTEERSYDGARQALDSYSKKLALDAAMEDELRNRITAEEKLRQ